MSVSVKLTNKILNNLRFDTQIDETGRATHDTPAGQREWIVWDASTRGLYLRLTPATISWYVRRKVGGRAMRRAMGHWFVADAPFHRLSLEAARTRAAEWHLDMGQGIDPREVKKQRIKENEASRAREGVTMKTAYLDYVEKKRDKSKEDGQDQTTVDRLKVVDWMEKAPIWHTPLPDLTEAHVETTFGPMHKAVWKRGRLPSWGPRSLSSDTLKKILTYLDAAYRRIGPNVGLASGKGMSPIALWRADRKFPRPTVRTRYLAVDEDEGLAWLKQLHVLRNQAHAPSVLEQRADPRGKGVKPHTSVLLDYYFCLLLWGTRRNEAAQMKWSWIDWKNNIIEFPVEVMKNRKATMLPLTPWAREILVRRRDTNKDWRGDEAGEWVFPSRVRGQHLAHARSILVELKRLTGTWITAHDLRRTLATMVGAKVEVEELARFTVVGAALGHSRNSQVTKQYIQRRAEALRPHLEDWENQLRDRLGLKPMKARPKKSGAELLKELKLDSATAQELLDALAKNVKRRRT